MSNIMKKHFRSCISWKSKKEKNIKIKLSSEVTDVDDKTEIKILANICTWHIMKK